MMWERPKHGQLNILHLTKAIGFSKFSRRPARMEFNYPLEHHPDGGGQTHAKLTPGRKPVSLPNALAVPDEAKTATISSKMKPSEIVSHLIDHGCKDVTNQLDLDQCGTYPTAAGGFGDIYQGVLVGGMKVAIKCPRVYLKNDQQGNKVLKDIAREIYASSKLKHPNVLELVGLSTFRGQISIVTPWMENGTLLEYITENLEVDRFQLCIQVAAGLAHLHEADQVHGDLKSMNVLVSESGVAKLTDFGNTTLKQHTLKFTGNTSGLNISIRWTAPEMLMGESTYTKEADVYALGMTFLEIVTGKIPYSDKLEPAVFATILSRKTPARPWELDAMDRNGANALWRAMSQCWSHEVPNRPSTLEVKSALAVLLPSWEQGRCLDITDRLDLSQCSAHPVARSRFGDIYRGALVGGEKVAIKCPMMYLQNDEQSKKLLKVGSKLLDINPSIVREIYALSRLKHPNILEVIGLSVFHKQFAVVSSWMGNGTLPEYISMYPGIDRFELCAQVSAGLSYLHKSETVHGDIRGENVLVSELGIAKLAGLGNVLIKRHSHEFQTGSHETRLLKRWAAPEILKEEGPYSKETDIYALGMTFLETVVGKVPFLGEPETKVYSNIVTGRTPERPSELDVMEKNRADALWMAISRCSSHTIASRPSAFEVEQILEKAAQQPYMPEPIVSTAVNVVPTEAAVGPTEATVVPAETTVVPTETTVVSTEAMVMPTEATIVAPWRASRIFDFFKPLKRGHPA